MVKRNKHNVKKMVRRNSKMDEKIVKMKEAGFSLREIGRAVGLTHPAVLYFLRKKVGRKVFKIKRIK